MPWRSKLQGWRLAVAVLAVAALAGAATFLALRASAAGNADASLAGSRPLVVPEPPLPPPRPHLVEPSAGVSAAEQATTDPATVANSPSQPKEIPPTDKEARAELAQLETLQLGSFTDRAQGGGWHSSVASVYTDYGQGTACGGVLKKQQIGVAHKTAPCGTLITFRYRGRSLQVPVIDRGPYIAGREWDLTGAAAAALGFPGLGPIEWMV